MQDEDKTKEQLLMELHALRERFAELKCRRRKHGQAEGVLLESEDQLERIIQAGRRISGNLNREAVCNEAASMFPEVVGSDAAALVLKDPQGQPRCVAQFGLGPAWTALWCRLTEHLLEEDLCSDSESYTTSDLHAVAGVIPMQIPEELPVRALLAVPIRCEDRVQGLLYAMRYSPAPFGPDTLQMAMLYAAQTAAAFGNACLYQSVQEELAERRQAERRLCESEERLQLALTGADLGMWDWNVSTGEVSFNERWSGMPGYSLEEIEAHVRTREKLIHPDDVPQVMEALRTHCEGRTPYCETEHRFIAKNGKPVWVLDKGKVTHRDPGGRPRRLVGTCLDISEAKQNQADRFLLEQQKHHAWRAESLSRMAGGIAHHFNNKLQAVMGYLELALEELPRGAELRSWIDSAMSASAQASEISQLMLAYLGQKTGKPELLDLVETIEEVFPFLISSMPKNVRLEYDLPSQGPVILADGVHIKQILTNVVSNSIEAIGEHEGQITVGIDVRDMGETRESSFFPLDWTPDSGSYACLSVADTGCGMSAETRERIFDPFFTTKFIGRGLGMPVTLGLI